MYRLTVALLAAFDAALAVAVGLAATLAPLTVLFVFGLGGGADWGMLWPASATVWQFGNLVPLAISLPGEYLAATGIAQDAASFTLSLAPLAFAAFTAVFAARSGVRASRADAWITGVVTGSIVFAALAAVVALTSRVDIADVKTWQAVVFPALLYAIPALIAAVVTEWSEAGGGLVAGVRDRLETLPHGWGAVPALAARGGAIAVAGLVGVGALVFAVALFARGGQVVALYESAHVDVVGAIVLTLGQLAYLPTLLVWAISFVAGPGFALGTGTAVSPAGTQVGVVPGIPALGVVPESTSTWLLLLALLPVAVGALAGRVARSRLVAGPVEAGAVRPVPQAPDAASDPDRTLALSGLLAGLDDTADATAPVDPLPAHADDPDAAADRELWPRLVVAVGIAVVAGAASAVLAAFASGSIGPGSLADVGPRPGPVGLVVGLEVLVGAGILLLSPRGTAGASADARPEQDAQVTPVD